MSAALSFLRAKLRALWHESQGHTVKVSKIFGRVDRIVCDCGIELWVRS